MCWTLSFNDTIFEQPLQIFIPNLVFLGMHKNAIYNCSFLFCSDLESSLGSDDNMMTLNELANDPMVFLLTDKN